MPRRLAAALIALTCALPLSLSAQRNEDVVRAIRWGVFTGANSSTLSGAGNDSPDRLWGFLGGAYIGVPLSTHVLLRPEVVYSQKGAGGSNAGVVGSGEGRVNVGYIEVPVLLQLEARSSSDLRPHLFAGPAVGINTSCTLTASGNTFSTSAECSELGVDVERLDISGVIGGGVAIPVAGLRLTLGARYTHGFRNGLQDIEVRNRVFSAHVGLEFGR
jgi:hypothetical protein